MNDFFKLDGGIGGNTLSYILPFILIALSIYLIYLNKDFLKKHDKAFRIILAVNLIILELFYQISMYNRSTSLQDFLIGNEMLPLHFCSIGLLLCIYTLLANDERTYKYLFFIAHLGFLLAFLFPDITVGFDRLRYYQFYISHGTFIITVYYFYFTRDIPITFKDYVNASLLMSLVGLFIVTPINIIYNTGFMFIVNYDDTPFELLPNVYVAYIGAIIVLWLGFYIVYVLTCKNRKISNT